MQKVQPTRKRDYVRDGDACSHIISGMRGRVRVSAELALCDKRLAALVTMHARALNSTEN